MLLHILVDQNANFSPFYIFKSCFSFFQKAVLIVWFLVCAAVANLKSWLEGISSKLALSQKVTPHDTRWDKEEATNFLPNKKNEAIFDLRKLAASREKRKWVTWKFSP